jgi:hypothetical protein
MWYEDRGTFDDTILYQIPYRYMLECEYRRGLDWRLDLIDYFNTRLVTTLNYNAIAYFHNLPITTTHAKPF